MSPATILPLDTDACLAALVERTGIPLTEVGHVTCGTVIQEPRTSNVAREAALTAGFPNSVSGLGFANDESCGEKGICKRA